MDRCRPHDNEASNRLRPGRGANGSPLPPPLIRSKVSPMGVGASLPDDPQGGEGLCSWRSRATAPRRPVRSRKHALPRNQRQCNGRQFLLSSSGKVIDARQVGVKSMASSRQTERAAARPSAAPLLEGRSPTDTFRSAASPHLPVGRRCDLVIFASGFPY